MVRTAAEQREFEKQTALAKLTSEILRVTGRRIGVSVPSRAFTRPPISSSIRDARIREEALRKAKGEAIKKQKELFTKIATKKRAEDLARQKAFIKKLREMSFKQKQELFRQQRELLKAQNIQKLIDRGKKVTSEAKAFREKVFREQQKVVTGDKEFISERQTGTFRGVPTTEIIIVDNQGKFIRKATPEQQKRFIEQQKVVTEFKPKFETKREEKLFNIKREQEALRQKKARTGKISLQEKLKLSKLEAQKQLLELSLTVKGLSDLSKAIKKDPSVLKTIPSEIRQGLVEEAKIVRTDPNSGIIKIGAEIFFFVGLGKVIRILGRTGKNLTTRLSPKFRGVKEGKIEIPSGQAGKKTIEIKITDIKLREPLEVQARLAGKEVTAVSAQADRIIRLLKTKRVVRKPIPGEAELSKKTKALLRKFDRRRITRRQLISLNKLIMKETKRSGSLLERSFFADPRGRLRKKRLGIQKEASLLDILAGDVTFKTQKPQVLLFERAKVQSFPKTKIFDEIKKELKKKNPVLSKGQSEALLKFQLKKGGKFKPIGALSREPEITLAPGEIIKKEKTIAVTIINGRSVPIIKARIIKPSKQTQKLLRKADKGKIKTKELKLLEKRLRKETGFKTSLSRVTRRPAPRPRLPARRKIGIVAARIGRPKKRITRRPARRPVGRVARGPPARPARRPVGRPARPPARPARRPVGRPVPRPVPRPPGRPPARPPLPIRPVPRPPVPIRKKKKELKIKEKKVAAVPVFNVFGKSRKKFVRLNIKPLSRNDALARGSFAIDLTTSRQFKIVPVGKSKKPGSIRKREKNYFKRQGFKFREFRVRKGRKLVLKDKFIEKVKHAIDQKSESKGLSIAKFLKQQRRQKIISPKQKKRVQRTTVSQATLDALARGRAIRMANLKKRK